MKIKTLGYAQLDRHIEENGADGVAMLIATRIAEGEDPRNIARSFNVPWMVLRGWIDENCSELVALAGKARADTLEYDATNEVDIADPDSLGVSKLRAEHYMKLASKLDRKKYGDKDIQDIGGGMAGAMPVVNITFVSADKRQELPVVGQVVIDSSEVVKIGND